MDKQYHEADDQDTTALGQWSHSEGFRSYSLGDRSHAEGLSSFSFGINSISHSDCILSSFDNS